MTKKAKFSKKRNNDFLIEDAKKSYYYEQYTLSMTICEEIINGKEIYCNNTRAEALEIKGLLLYYHTNLFKYDYNTNRENVIEEYFVYLDRKKLMFSVK